MCGRFTRIVPLESIVIRFTILNQVDEKDYKSSYNIAPGQNINAIINDGRRNRFGQLRWGLVPSWAKDPKIGNKLINARAETIADKPSFRDAFLKRRCLIPADSFYEWKHDDENKKMKTPMRFQLKSGELFALAGIWESWKAPDGHKIFSCAIITTEANELMAPIHNRMPVMLRKEDEKFWLDPSNHDLEALSQLLIPYSSENMEAYQVSEDVNSVKNDGPNLIKKVRRDNENHIKHD
ncbi:SOS response-associated peptidase [Sporolactobacillus pectinivorans]|uniref:SOS response-associated peptidase n=1 Tax=Sporolactobacillus pectinivorans TaxID=1591408 RepID=UPI000C260CEF|nr:SOS response-associated peptidase [Sporolactobacillus pectinivorans]